MLVLSKAHEYATHEYDHSQRRKEVAILVPIHQVLNQDY